MRRHVPVTVLAAILAFAVPMPAAPQGGPMIESAEPFKVGTFEADAREFVGIVLRDRLIVELDAANTHLELGPDYPEIAMPDDMIGLIERYDYGLRYRVYEIVNHLVAGDMLAAGSRPAYVHQVDDVRTLAPIRYPGKILNAAVNFYSHIDEAGTPEERAEAMRERRENRGVPYLFLKPGRGAVVGDGDDIVIPGAATASTGRWSWAR